MRIAHVTATFPPYGGGTGNVCFYNARELARRGHEVHVFTAAQPRADAIEGRDGITIHRLRPLLRMGNAPVLPALLWQLRNFDVLHLHYPFFGGELTALAAKLNRTPLVITYHQDVLLSGLMGLIEKVLRLTIGRMALRAADRLLFTSEDYGRTSYVRPMLRGREGAIGALPNGVDVKLFSPGSPATELREQVQLAPGNQVVLLVAALDQAHYFKGVAVLLEALARLPSHVKGVIVGDGDLRPTYEAAAEDLGISSRVFFPGRAPDDILPDYYRLAEVTVLPSTTMGEAFGLVLLESLACATTVIASDLPGVRTVVDDGQDGYLLRPGDAADLAAKLERMLGLPAQERQAMGTAGRRKVETSYAWPQIGDQLELIYSQVLEQPGVSPARRQEAS